MIYYKIIVSFPKSEPELNSGSERDNRMMIRSKAQQFRIQTDEYNAENPDTYVFLSSLLDNKCYIGAFGKETIEKQQIVSYLDCIGQKHTDIRLMEITFDAIFSMLNTAQRNFFVEDDAEVLERLNLDRLARRTSRFTEIVLTDMPSKAVMLKTAEDTLSSSLKDEIGRIFQYPSGIEFIGHPVHYIIETDSFEKSRKLFEILLSALYRANRLQNRRYAVINISNHVYGSEYVQLCRSSIGGAVVLNYTVGDAEESEFADDRLENLKTSIDKLKEFQNETLAIICLPKACNKIKDILFGIAGNCTFVEIKEDVVFGDRAKNYLRQQAKSKKITPDRTLYQEVTDSKTGFSSSELDSIFENWLNTMLKTKVYPQYAELQSAKRQIAEKKPDGSAYEELQKMVGLQNAKRMVDRALNYYKAQQLFKDRGMQTEHPAMHMVFTGNPGTAKTTVARLFARVMKENGLLSEGRLYEVGRANLVGKYVGWTAQIVKETFEKAKGSVLFIDEAYSLLDDRSGMFGDEAINTIVQEMENHREDIVVIFAGYPNEMDQFLSRNPGLRSRIAFHIPFEDYTAEELYRIVELIAGKSGLTFAEGIKEKLLPVFRSAAEQDDFGNGRFARNLLEQAKMKQADRLLQMEFDSVTKDDVTTLLPEDFELPPMKKAQKQRIGFIF